MNERLDNCEWGGCCGPVKFVDESDRRLCELHAQMLRDQFGDDAVEEL